MKKIEFLIIIVLFNEITALNLDKSIKNKINPTLLISLDGFRSSILEEFLKENPKSTLQKEFVEIGIKSEYMKPAYPSNTFPNHYSMITGKITSILL
jgi:predicted AlkP superfamily pyrophosphatase or phosphodiesterase